MLLLFDQSEIALYTLNNELRKIHQLSHRKRWVFLSKTKVIFKNNSGNINLMPRIALLGSVTDENGLGMYIYLEA